MQILKSKSERMPEINPFAGEQSSTNQTVISLDKWVADAKANKAAYEANRKSIDELRKDIQNHIFEQVDRFIKMYPPNIAQYNYPHLVNLNPLSWNKDALYALFSDMSGYGGGNSTAYLLFRKFMLDELREFIGISKEEIENMYMINNWSPGDYEIYITEKYNSGNY